MEYTDAQIADQMKDVVALLEDHDLVPAEAAMESILDKVKAPSTESVREKKLVNLRQRLQSGIRHVQGGSPFTAVIRFRKALTTWLAT